jgi:hypothetical protein
MPREDRQKLVFRQLSSTILNMGFFDGLEREGLIAPTGYIRKCMNDRIGGVEIDNLLLDMFLNESSEHAATFTNAQKGEFIFHIFRLLCVGGAMHQRDELVNDYLETTKALYKELLTVHKKATGSDGNTKIEVTSKVYEVALAPTGESAVLFSGSVAEHSRCYVVIDVKKRYATVVFSPFKPFW